MYGLYQVSSLPVWTPVHRGVTHFYRGPMAAYLEKRLKREIADESISLVLRHSALGARDFNVFGSDVDIVRRGALAAYGVDWRESGLTLATMVGGLLSGQPIESLPIQNPDKLVLHINLKVAKKMGLSLPEDLQKKADKVL